MKNYFLSAFAVSALVSLFSLAAIPTGLSLAYDVAFSCMALIFLLAFFPGKSAKLFFVTLCAWVVVRYLAWRFDSLPLDTNIPTTIGALALLSAEIYGAAMLLLGLFVNARPLERTVCELPDKEQDYPFVDIYIPTYSEPVEVVFPTIVAATNIDYPKDKFRVFVLDDGFNKSKNEKNAEIAHFLQKRSIELQAICQKHGATWFSRPTNEHAKSGNLNAAMERTSGELILVLDADHVPSRNILKNTVGLFVKNKTLGFIQTPHFFLNPDPLEKNLELFNKVPAENDMFYRVVQKGLDLWNASFFCGSAAVIRRKALDSVGGFSTISITEDASTSVKMHQKKWDSAYLAKPMVAGLQPETFSGFTTQRLRWAMGMIQIFLKQNPLLVKGLSFGQRVSYLSVVMFWLFPFARIVFFLAPLLAIFFNLTIYPMGVDYFFAYTLPYLFAVLMSFEKTFGRVRSILLSEVYETLQAFYSLPALLKTFINPSKPQFKVTPKGETTEKAFISHLKAPFYVFYGLVFSGLIWGSARLVFDTVNKEVMAFSIAWLFFNFVLLSAAMGTLFEKPQRRIRPRVEMNKEIEVDFMDGKKNRVVLLDLNEVSGKIKLLDYKENFELPTKFKLKINDQWMDVSLMDESFKLKLKNPLIVRFECKSAMEEKKLIDFIYGDSEKWEETWKNRESSFNFLFSAMHISYVSISKALKHLKFISKN